MCTVLLRFTPGSLVLAAVRDEFLERPWDPPAQFWPGLWGGRDRTAGGTWLAVRPDRPAVAALLNGVRRPPATRPTRGGLALSALREEPLPELTDYDGFHLVLGTPTSLTVWSWDGSTLDRHDLDPGDHIVVNQGVDTVDDPLVPYFAPRLARVPDPGSTMDSWTELLRGDGLPPDDDRALLVGKDVEGRRYGSGSASLVVLSENGVRYDFTATPFTPDWRTVI